MDEKHGGSFNEIKPVRADRAMKATKAVMLAVGAFNLLVAAALALRFLDLLKYLPELGLKVYDRGRVFICFLLYSIFILPPSSGFGLGTAIFFLRDQKRIGIFDRSCVFFIILFTLSLVPGLMFAGSMILSMFGV